ncbi:XkdX family protein [Caproicibacterium sp. XB1]
MSFWQMAYAQKWATIDQLKLAVTYSLITADNFKTITGTDYSASTTATA